ncbi:hypothetical protein [uncultured Sulfuricurvum sp.]|uniref:hypothetical protein n=1 Tax=Sulfuricurvum sp. TaxID=2025608 RepID=UPI0026359E30|nr:hypothetical protein [uncultured Sulfuricurvum sp.]
MQNENITKFIEHLKNNWQLLAFGVFFFGYITFALYMQMNGFSFVIPDLKFLIAFGLIVSLFAFPILFLYSQNENYWKITIVLWILLPLFFPNNEENWISSISTIIVGAGLIYDLLIVNDKKIDNTIWIIFIIIALFINDIYSAIFLFFYSLSFYFLRRFYLKRKIHDPFNIVIFLLILSYLTALLTSEKGLMIANMGKCNASFISDQNKSIHGHLIFQDNNTLYLSIKNQKMSFDKTHITSPIYYEKTAYKTYSLYEKTKNQFFK